jgi:NAD(P)-dependent dehydrogenase (short-subunit alcohol dehydrogenase family)
MVRVPALVPVRAGMGMTSPANAVIIGHGPGIGAAVARAFGREGMSLSLLARDSARLNAAVADLATEGHVAAAFPADAADDASLTAALAAARTRFGEPEVLVYNAATWRPGPVLAADAAGFVSDFRVCVTGALTASAAVVPAMRARGRGTLLFTGGGFALFPSPVAPSLSIGKAGIRALALMLARELAPSGIRVGTVTIMGTVRPGTRFDPDLIAQRYIDLHRGRPDPDTAEVSFA